MPNIYLGKREGKYSDSYNYAGKNYDHEVSITNEIFDEDKRFKRVSYSITYNYDWFKFLKESYYISLYEGESKLNKRTVKFSYYNETNTSDQVVKKIEIHYPLINQCEPLAIVLIDQKDKNYIILYGEIKGRNWLYNYDIQKYFLKRKLKDMLIEEYNKMLRSITFYLTNDTSHNIKQIPEYRGDRIYLGKSNIFYLISFISNSQNDPELFLKVFKEIKTMKSQASNDSGVNCEGVVAYYSSSNDEPLLIECVSESNPTYFMRAAISDNLQWIKLEKPITYNNESELEKILRFILLCLENKIIVKLDKKQPYDDNKIAFIEENGQEQIQKKKTLQVTNECKDKLIAPEGYSCYKHNLSEYYNEHIRSMIQNYISDDISNNVQLQLLIQVSNKPIRSFENPRSTKENVYYQPSSSNDIYVYFWNNPDIVENEDGHHSLNEIPLLILYGNKGYKPYGTMSNIYKWIKINDIEEYFTESSNGSTKKNPKQLLDKIKKKVQEQEIDKTKSTETTDSGESEEETSREQGKDDYRDIFRIDGKYELDKNIHSWDSVVGGTLGGILGIGGGMFAIYYFYRKNINVRRLFSMRILK